jgi:hypothetical protein
MHSGKSKMCSEANLRYETVKSVIGHPPVGGILEFVARNDRLEDVGDINVAYQLRVRPQPGKSCASYCQAIHSAD